MQGHQTAIEDRLERQLAAARLFGASTAPARIGRFTVLRMLGRGGMGIVYSAYDEDLNRRVALKLLRTGSSQAPIARARMLREAQALARLSHPNVVQIHDVGECDGQVFIAMEYVEGQTLRAWSSGAPRSWREVLDAFLQAGRGLAAAHEKGLVHRDFKPENVLIGNDGRTRVVDFGLASLNELTGDRATPGEARGADDVLSLTDTHDEGTPGGRLTQTGTLLGTARYMSPEQHLGRATDTRTDQFSFSVALHEALYGTCPFISESHDELIRQVCCGNIEPPPRSTKVPRRIHDAIVRGLAPDPAARWRDMHAFLAELCRDPGAVRRQWLLLGTMALVGAGGVSMSRTGATEDGPLCERPLEKLAGVWDTTRRVSMRAAFVAQDYPDAAVTWERVSRILDDYVEAWMMMHSENCTATFVRGEQSGEALDLRTACLERRRQDFVALTDILASPDHQVLENAVQAASNLPSLAPCADVETLKATLPPPEERAQREAADRIVANIAEARALGEAGKYREGLDRAEAAATDVASIDYPPITAEAMLCLGRLQEHFDIEAAEASLFAALQASAAGKHDLVFAQAAARLVWVVGGLRHKYELGVVLGRMGEAAVLRAGNAPLDRADLDNYLGNVWFLQGDFEQARVHFERSLAIRTRTLGPNHSVLAKSLIGLGATYTKQARFEEAAASQERAIAIIERSLGPTHPQVAKGLTNLGIVRDKQGRFEEAIKHYRRALQVNERTFGPEHVQLTGDLTNLGIVLTNVGRLDEAGELLQRSLLIKERTFGPDSVKLTAVLNSLAVVRTDQGRRGEARAMLERAAMIFKQADPGGPEASNGMINLGNIDLMEGKLNDASEMFGRALELRERAFGPEHPDVAAALTLLSEVHRRKGDFSGALQLAERALVIYDANPDAAYGGAPRALVEAAEACLGLGRRERAQELLEQALSRVRVGGSADEAAGAQFALARMLIGDGVSGGARAIELARSARSAYAAGGPGKQEALARVDAWLDARQDRASALDSTDARASGRPH